MATRPWMPLYVGDFLAETTAMSATETGIYIRLLMHCWEHGHIPNDPRKLAMIAHCDTRIWHLHGKSVLQKFDVETASTMQHNSITRELRRCEEISNKRKGAAQQKHSNSSAFADSTPMQTACKQGGNTTSHKERKREALREEGSKGVAETTFIKLVDPRWWTLAKRYAAENGGKDVPTGLRNSGYAFPAHWLNGH